MARRRSLLAQRHLATNREAREGRAHTWDRRRFGGMVHYRLWDNARLPPQSGTCSFALDVPRHVVADTLRRIRRMMRE